MENIKILQLPDNLNPKDLLRDKTIEIYGKKCPFCASSSIATWLESQWYGKKSNNPFELLKFWEKNYHWQQIGCKCHRCNAIWTLPPYPIDVIKPEDFDNILRTYLQLQFKSIEDQPDNENDIKPEPSLYEQVEALSETFDEREIKQLYNLRGLK